MNTLSEVLAAVAAGQMTPEEASAQIEALRATSPSREVSAAAAPPAEIYIKAGGSKLIVIGDPTVTEAVADGVHRMERTGDTLMITTSRAEGDFSTTAPRSAFRHWLNAWIERAGQTLTVRVNPAIPLRVLNVGGTLDLTGVSAGASIGIEAGSATLDNGSGPLNLDITSGSAKVTWTFTGNSSVKADMGSATVNVQPGSDVLVTTEASLGQATVWSGATSYKTNGSDSPTPAITVGNGTGTLNVVARMGSAQVTVA